MVSISVQIRRTAPLRVQDQGSKGAATLGTTAFGARETLGGGRRRWEFSLLKTGDVVGWLGWLKSLQGLI